MYLLDHVKYKHSTFHFLTLVIYSFHSMSCLVWRTHLPLPPVGPLSQPPLSFHFNVSCAHFSLLLLFHETSLTVLHTPPSEILVVEGVPCLSVWPVFCRPFSFSHLPIFFWFCATSQGLWERGCHFVLLVQCLAQ